MPYKIARYENRFCVEKFNPDTGAKEQVDGGCHDAYQEALNHMRALFANVEDASKALGDGQAMIAFFMPPRVAQSLHTATLNAGLPPEPINNLHVTVIYLGDTAALKPHKQTIIALLRQFSAERMALTGIVNGVGRFQGADPNPIYANLDSSMLPDYRQALVRALEGAGIANASEHGFSPHITLAYSPATAPMPNVVYEPLSVNLAGLTLAWDNEHITFELSAASNKALISQEDADYQVQSPAGGDHLCAFCSHYTPQSNGQTGACNVIENGPLPIVAQGWCQQWTPLRPEQGAGDGALIKPIQEQKEIPMPEPASPELWPGVSETQHVPTIEALPDGMREFFDETPMADPVTPLVGEADKAFWDSSAPPAPPVSVPGPALERPAPAPGFWVAQTANAQATVTQAVTQVIEPPAVRFSFKTSDKPFVADRLRLRTAQVEAQQKEVSGLSQLIRQLFPFAFKDGPGATATADATSLNGPFPGDASKFGIFSSPGVNRGAGSSKGKTPTRSALQQALARDGKAYLTPKSPRWSQRKDVGLLIQKGLDGQRLMFLITSNSYKDREDETITTKALKRYVESAWAVQGKCLPRNKFLLWHKGDAIGDVVWCDMEGPFLIEVVKERRNSLVNLNNPGEPPRLAMVKEVWDMIERESAKEAWGASHGFEYPTGAKSKDGTYETIYKFETSALPLRYAANPITLSTMIERN